MRRQIASTCTKCGAVWNRRWRAGQGSLCKPCQSSINGSKSSKGGRPRLLNWGVCRTCKKESRFIHDGYCKIHRIFPNGSSHYNWKGGITTQDRTNRMKFRKNLHAKILKRDNYTCQICDAYGGNLQVDHIKNWSDFPDLRFDESNCRTLCMACHYYVTFKRKLPEGVVWGHNLSKRIQP